MQRGTQNGFQLIWCSCLGARDG